MGRLAFLVSITCMGIFFVMEITHAGEIYGNCQHMPTYEGAVCAYCDDRSDELHSQEVTLPDGTVFRTDQQVGGVTIWWGIITGPQSTFDWPMTLPDIAILWVKAKLGIYEKVTPVEILDTLCGEVPDAIIPVAPPPAP